MLELTKEQNLMAGLEVIIAKLKSGEFTVEDCEQREIDTAIEYIPIGASRSVTRSKVTEYQFSLRHKK